MLNNDDTGSVSALVLGLLMSFIACAGLAIDGGRLVAKRIQVADHAENAARVGAQAVTDIRTGVPRVDSQQAVKITQKFLSKSLMTGYVTANKLEVCVVVRENVPMSMLALIGVRDRVVTAERCARPISE